MATNRFDEAITMLQDCWNLLAEAPGAGRSALVTPVIGTVDPAGGGAAMRTVILRKAVPSERTLTFFCDARSDKVAHLRTMPRLAYNFYDPERQLQIRCRGRAILHLGDETAARQWERIGLEGRANYASLEPPGTPLARAAKGLPDYWRDDMALERTEYAFANFAVVIATIEALDCLLLHPDGHQRVIFRWETAVGEWRGGWVVP